MRKFKIIALFKFMTLPSRNISNPAKIISHITANAVCWNE